jgi:uncharacterized membrane protein YdfJ with MMPL/SSD domain
MLRIGSFLDRTSSTTEKLAIAAARRPLVAVGVWIAVLVVGVVTIGTLLSGLTSEPRLTNDPESYRGEALVAEHFPGADEVQDIVVVRSEEHTVGDPQFREFVLRLAGELRADGDVASISTFYETGDRGLASRDGHATILPLVVAEDTPPPEEQVERVIAAVDEVDGESGFDTAITGEWTIDRDFNKLSQKDLKEGEAFFGGPAALVVLLIVFGTLVAAGIPLVLGIVAIVLSLALAALVAQVFEVSLFVTNIITAVGLALGVDYSLFVVSRYREERRRGREKLDAIAAAGATASRAVLFSGTAFVIAMIGLLLVPEVIMRSLAFGAIAAGVVSVLAALTLLPAVLSLLGDRLDALRVPLAWRAVASGEREGAFWGRVARAVMRRPVVSVVAATAVLVAAAIPVLELETGFPAVSVFPASTASREGLEALDRDFRGGQADPVQVVVRGDVRSGDTQAGIARLRARMAADPAFGPSDVRSSPDGEIAVVSAPTSGSATDPEPVRAVKDLRREHVPAAFAGVDVDLYVTGETARNVDYFETMRNWLPIAIAIVLALTLVLLTVAFRSVVVAGKAILFNLLSVGAAYGLLVLVFMKGYGAGLLGFEHVDAVVAWVPLFLFSILFGLSMDYHVFLLSRIRERFTQTGNNADSVEHGLITTARLITGAALIIIVVFVGFSTGDLVMFQQMGFGIAVALLIDATLIRSVLVPAAMVLLGDRNWYLPRWLQWLPEVRVEAETR